MGQDFPPLLNDNLLKVATGKKPSRIPIWIMRQAGRYLPEFREMRKTHDFFEILNTPELASEITLQPIRRYDLDAAIIFSDILVIPTALDMDVKMEPGVGPVIKFPFTDPQDAIAKLTPPINFQDKMKGTLEAITLTRNKLEGKVPLLGFAGAPWTLLSYMIEGGGSRTQMKAKSWLYKYPEESTTILSLLANHIKLYLAAQVAAGAQMVQLFESHAEILGPELFTKFSFPFLKSIVEGLPESLKELGLPPVPVVVFAKGAHYALDQLNQIPCNVIGLDWTIKPELARQALPEKVLQGNLDPVALFGDRASIEANVNAMISKFGTQNYICNLGHGIYPETPTDGVQAFIEAVHSIPI
ncbi:unnamed protein product [Allacma fusca]|uniref:Uroporphyrinogen decarboxylase n=1 Tax=Allacma fusca TaxID=39272 RepID=A0A8J2PIH1_9HEXA|nr:unnamed protein product [Allacma fusca]